MKIFSLEGQVALVTGASRGLGFAMASALSSAGATVVLCARSRANLEAAEASIRKAGGNVDIEPFDLTDQTAIGNGVRNVLARHGRIDVLLNNAGICEWSDFEQSTLEMWHRTMQINVTAAYLLAQAVSGPMIERGRGRIINVGSYVSVLGREKLQAYVASKHALAGLTKSLGAELGRHGILCNGICPGYFMTDMAEPVTSNPQMKEIVRSHISVGRWGRPEELGGAAVFLASEASSYMNGHMLMVDGGVSEILSFSMSVV
ncbi:gluconate 5-dehydrogenase [Trinickia symbiotica]|uniref:Short-chain dehydrogenase n=1 Tax=Trinickia symbiotica TaxID=863227 RepID=A0A2N7X5B0_9BURK|nr:SDR family oxidoreductase [Trinickia symbiotica]PMS36732.1 short-chain dehydrogenase [Trinickia symbiotica]PPK46179.1 gluconate 5-dehydrogenase [Trinickia symbiotica]